MSTYFKSAAMSLLSKTLQKLLYKYLSEVDVEGINLPSLYNSDGHSGWGVRLSNVKLREGAKLMDLPGSSGKKRKKKEDKKKKRQKRKKKERPSKGERVAASEHDGGGHDAGDDARWSESKTQSRDARNEGSVHDPDGNATEANPNGAELLAPHGPIHKGNDHNEDGAATAAASAATDAAATTTSSSSSWFFWYSSSTPQPTQELAENDPPPSVDEDAALEGGDAVDGGTGSDAPPRVDDKDMNDVDKGGRMNGSNMEDEYDPLIGTLPSSKDESTDARSFDEGSEGEESDDESYYSDDDEEEDEEEEQEEELPLILRLGKGSTIGILDVRLVGKDIHVYVEDAYIEIEAVSLAADLSNDAKADNPDQASPDKKRPSAKKMPETHGERVLSEIAIARALAALPNLFIRDVRVRLVVRDEPVVQTVSEDDQSNAAATDANPPTEQKYSPEDAIVDFTVELLSITDGSDFLSTYRATGDADDEIAGATGRQELEPLSERGESDPYDQNEYLVKRIRTGRGPDGGICLKIYPPRHILGRASTHRHDDSPWAWHSFESLAQSCALRCSGLDLRGRVYMGTRLEAASYDDWLDGEYDEDYNVDSMLFGGVDYIAPGPQQKPLPPMAAGEQPPMSSEDKYWEYEGATIYQTDENGIQYSGVKSVFHRVGRGGVPIVCKGDHLPCEICPHCWENNRGAPRFHSLDAATPMGGLVLSILTRDPLEINIDRPSLEVMGDVLGLFRKNPVRETPRDTPDECKTPGRPTPTDNVNNDEISQSEQSSIGYLSRSSSRRLASNFEEEEPDEDDPPQKPIFREVSQDEVKSSFPVYMQPEKIQILGFHVSELVFRVHVMQHDGLTIDEGFSYCFWDLHAKCLTMDYQALAADEKSFQDLRFDIGHLTTQEYKGTEDKQIISIGLRKRVVEFDEMTIETLKTLEEMSNRPPWPNTAAALLDVQPPLETLMYEVRDRHAIQMRYISVLDPSSAITHRKRTHAYVRFGPASIDAPYEIKSQVPTIIGEARSTVFGRPPDNSVDNDDTLDDASALPKIDAIMIYKIHLDGGRVKLLPRMEVKLPRTVLTGVRSSELGLFFETLLDKVQFNYGEKDEDMRVLEHGISLQQLAALPESVRLRVLLFLPDLKPMENALCIKTESDSFLRCRSVNKGIVKVAKRAARRAKVSRKASGTSTIGKANRRQELMDELLKLDDDTLEDLVSNQRRYLRKNSSRNKKKEIMD